MKQLLLLIMMLIITSCESSYIQVMDIEDGRVTTILDRHHLTNVKDTIVITTNSRTAIYSYYGKYTGKMPEMYYYDYTTQNGDTLTNYILYSKVIRIK